MKYLVFFSFFHAFQLLGAQPTIRILPEAYVEGPYVRLAEIAVLDSVDKKDKKRLARVTLTDAPSFGEVRKFSSSALASILRAKISESKYKFSIPTTVIIRNKSSKVSRDTISAKILESISTFCAECEVEIRDLNLPKIEWSSDTTWDLTPDWSRVRGPFQIPLEVSSTNGQRKTYWISGKISLKRKVVVSRRNINFGEKIDKSDVELQVRDVTFKQDLATKLEEVVGSITRAGVPANTPLSRSLVQRPHALVRGQNVTVRMGEPSWKVVVKGVAEQSGYIGDQVRVKNLESKRLIVGYVVEEGVVEVR